MNCSIILDHVKTKVNEPENSAKLYDMLQRSLMQRYCKKEIVKVTSFQHNQKVQAFIA